MNLNTLEFNLIRQRSSPSVPGTVPSSQLILVMVLTIIITVSELVLAQLTHCISLLVLVHQNIYNCLTLIVTCVTRWKGEESLVNTFGWKRMEVVGSLSSLIFLFSLCFATAIESLQTLFHNDHLDTLHHPDWIMLLLVANLTVWAVSLLILGGYTHHQTKSVRQDKPHSATACSICCSCSSSHISRDLASCLFTFLSSVIVYYEVLTERFSAYLDPVIALVSIIFLVSSSIRITKDSCLILLQTIPGKSALQIFSIFECGASKC